MDLNVGEWDLNFVGLNFPDKGAGEQSRAHRAYGPYCLLLQLILIKGFNVANCALK